MVHAARASAPRAATPPSTRQFLIDSTAIRDARNSPENNTLNFSNRSKIACFSAHFAPHNSPITTQQSVALRLHPYFPQFLIASRPGLEIELTPSQQTRNHFLIASFSGISAPAPHLNTEIHGSIGKLAGALRFWIGALGNQSNQGKYAQARLPMLPQMIHDAEVGLCNLTCRSYGNASRINTAASAPTTRSAASA